MRPSSIPSATRSSPPRWPAATRRSEHPATSEDGLVPSASPPALPKGSFSTSDQPRITVDDALLRPWILDDAAALVEAFDDPAIRQWHVSRADTVDEARELIAHWQGGWADESEFNWAIVGADDALL